MKPVDILELQRYAFNLLKSRSGTSNCKCKICKCVAEPFDMVDFNKIGDYNLYPMGLSGIPVIYHRCNVCGFVFTKFFDEFPSDWWSKYIYNEEYYLKIDPEYKSARPIVNAKEISAVLTGKHGVLGLDYGGGSGMTAQLLREQGFSFDCYDPYGMQDTISERLQQYNFCTAIEVFEHLPDPVETLKSILIMCHDGPLTILIGTSTSDAKINLRERLKWWYVAPRNGHISIFSRKSLLVLASQFNLRYVGYVGSTHVLCRNTTGRGILFKLFYIKLQKKITRILKYQFNFKK